MTISKLAPLLLLAACATSQPISQPVEVRVPAAVPCHAPQIQEPAWPLDSLPIGADIYTQAKTMIAELEARIAYEMQLKAANLACQ